MRRAILGLTAFVAITLGGCTTAQIATTVTQIEGAIQSGVAIACGIVPELNVITTVAGALFPGLGSILALTAPEITAVENEICTAAPAPASARYKALPRYGSYPAPIGTTVHVGVHVTGWRP